MLDLLLIVGEATAWLLIGLAAGVLAERRIMSPAVRKDLGAARVKIDKLKRKLAWYRQRERALAAELLSLRGEEPNPPAPMGDD